MCSDPYLIFIVKFVVSLTLLGIVVRIWSDSVMDPECNAVKPVMLSAWYVVLVEMIWIFLP